MATKLKGLVVDRVDLVDIGANLDKRTGDGAHIMLFKRATDAPVTHSPIWRVVDLAKALHASADLVTKTEAAARSFDEILAGQKARRALDQLWDLYYAFMESAQSIFASDEADKIGLLRGSAVDFMNAFLGALPEAVDDGAVEMGVEKVGRKISAARMKQLTEMHAKLGSLLKEVSEGDAMKIAEFAKSIGVTVAENATEADVQKAVNDHIAAQVATQVAKAGGSAEAISVEVQKALDAAKAGFDAELKKRDDEIAKANALAKSEKDLRVLKQFTDQARSEFVGLPLQLEKDAAKPESRTDAEIFKALSELAPAEWPRVEAILKGAAEALRTSKMFAEQGASHAATAGSAEAQIMQLAEAMVVAKTAATREQAIAKVAADPQHAALYGRYVDEQRERTKH